MKLRINWDAFGIATSIACAIHCAFLPLFLTSLPLLGLEILSSEAFEIGMIVLAFLIGAWSLSHGYRKHHHHWLPLIIFSIGFCFLVAKQVVHHQVHAEMHHVHDHDHGGHDHDAHDHGAHDHAHHTMGFSSEMVFLSLAVIGIVSAHIVNFYKCRKAGHCHTTDCNH